MTDHVGAVSEAESRGGSNSSHTSGFAWWRVIVVLLVIGVALYGIYRLMWPASYLGEVRWVPGYSAVTLVGSGMKLDVGDDTQIDIGSGSVSLESLRGPLFPPQVSAFRAQVVYRPYLGGRRANGAAGFAQLIEAR